jgi:hypothetical protein
LRFDLADGAAQARLRDTEFVGGVAEAARSTCRDENLKLSQGNIHK